MASLKIDTIGPGTSENEEDEAGPDIVVVGTHETKSVYPEVRLVLDYGGGQSIPNPNAVGNWIAETFRNFTYNGTQINTDGLTAHQKQLFASALAKLESSQQFKADFAHQKELDLRIDVVDVVTRSQIGGNVAVTEGLANGYNGAPLVPDALIEVIGTHSGLVGTIVGTDPTGDAIHYRLSEVDGAYADQSWTVDDSGHIFANFIRQDAPGSEFSSLLIVASNGVTATQAEITVRWGSSGSPNPELRPAHTDVHDGGDVGFRYAPPQEMILLPAMVV